MALWLLVCAATLSGQTYQDAVRPFVGLSGAGARVAGLAGAFTGIADDATSLLYNPAGLAHLTKLELNLGLTHLNVATDGTSPGNSISPASISATRLGNAILVLPVPHSKLTVAGGYNLVRAFENQSDTEICGLDECSGPLSQEGRLGTLSLGAGYQVSTKLALGGAVEVIMGSNVYTENYRRPDSAQEFIQIEPAYTGVGLSMGVLISPLPVWRLGLLLWSPRQIAVDEDFAGSEFVQDTYEYDITSSYSAHLGTSLGFGPLLVTGNLSWFDYSQIRFDSHLVVTVDSQDVSIDFGINDTLRREYAAVLTYAAGAELLLPLMNIKLRAGYRRDPPITRNPSADAITHTIALGGSVVPVPQIKLDLAISLTTWERDLGSVGTERTLAVQGWFNLSYRL